jgi:hypothetical protein
MIIVILESHLHTYMSRIIIPPAKGSKSWTMTGRHPQFDTTYLHSGNQSILPTHYLLWPRLVMIVL